MLHCPQGIPWSLKVQLLIREYPFQIMLYYAILSARNTILLHMTCPCIALSYGNITLFQRDCCICERVSFWYKNLNHTMLSHTLSQALLCVLKATFSKGCYTLLKGILCIIVCLYTYLITSYSELCYLKMILHFPNEDFFERILHNTIV